MQASAQEIILRQAVPLSACNLWQLQKNFFDQQGIEAWVGKVPFYITCNPYIANAYAQVIIRFIQDCVKKGIYNPLEPFYILELGAGSGMFGFYTLKRLLELRECLHLTEIKFVYVLTDFTTKNIDYWAKHPAFQPLLARGVLEFAHYNLEHKQNIHLINSNKLLKKALSYNKYPANPLIVIANYIFDSIGHDAFKLAQGQLQEGLVTLQTVQAAASGTQPLTPDNVKIDFSYHDTSVNYYDDERINAILAHYVNHYDDLKLLMPIGSLRCIQHLQEIANENLLLLATDKGFAKYLETYSKNEPFVAFHGSFSLTVNFHALSQYFKLCDGDYYFQTLEQNITSCAFVSGQKFRELVETKAALDNHFNLFGPGNLFSIYQHMIMTQREVNLRTIISHLTCTHWDPVVFEQYFELILQLISHSEETTVRDLLALLPTIAAQYYYMPAQSNTLFKLGFVLQQLQHYGDAIQYYQQALSYSHAKESIYYQMGVCYFHLQNYQMATSLFHDVIALNKDHIEAYGWLGKIQKIQRLDKEKV